MGPSYERINYALRAAKSVQRKMLVEAFRRLSPFGPINSYRYIGFGSTYFSDFVLFHKMLGINRLMSIEKDALNRQRFEFNRPYSCIQLLFGDSNEVLPTLHWNHKTILWLDYDGTLEPGVLADVKYFCASALPGSVLIVTVNAEPTEYKENESRLAILKSALGVDKVPPDVKEEDLSQWGTARVYKRIITTEIRETLGERNGTRGFDSAIQYRQLFDFCYADGARMLTVGGLIFERVQKGDVEGCRFKDLPFVRSDIRAKSKPYMIEVPSLTFREIRHLDKQLPRMKRRRITSPKVPMSDLKRYERIYRYFPAFAETEV